MGDKETEKKQEQAAQQQPQQEQPKEHHKTEKAKEFGKRLGDSTIFGAGATIVIVVVLVRKIVQVSNPVLLGMGWEHLQAKFAKVDQLQQQQTFVESDDSDFWDIMAMRELSSCLIVLRMLLNGSTIQLFQNPRVVSTKFNLNHCKMASLFETKSYTRFGPYRTAVTIGSQYLTRLRGSWLAARFASSSVLNDGIVSHSRASDFNEASSDVSDKSFAETEYKLASFGMNSVI
ncbi:hypothetical protein OGAPHI_000328 [Ogataea philodendri]|uniref:Uncharacterized protein n=1 Tax=Ogataea philodendri TaxID=1378263 RepID=A0A9P8PHA2_9ASCO|nr:uncharacterized protein OGAPHI_000328 [Ogataea philodendri]KAH3671625.1 hypothetical protein OGAPHI_000328 [Ogataea philodendri]